MLSSQMTSVERVVEYTELKGEADWTSQEHSPPPDWPSKGQLTFHQMNFSYSGGGPLVLKDISAAFRPCEKVSARDCRPAAVWALGSHDRK